MRLRSSFEAKVILAFGMAIFVVLVLCAITWTLAADAAEAARQIERTQNVLHALALTRSATLQTELSTQSYRISGDERHLTDRDTATSQREELLQGIHRLTSGYPTQQARWTELRAVIDQRMALSKQIESVRKTQGQQVATALVAASPLHETRARTHRLLDAMEQDERQRLEQRSAARERTGALMRLVGALATVILSAQLVATYVMLRRQWRDAETSRRQLADSAERLSLTLRSIGEAVMATDMDGLVTRMNPVAERLTGWPATQALGRHVDEVFRTTADRNGEPVACPIADVLQSGVAQAHERGIALMARDGSACPISMSVTPKRDLSGHLRGTVLEFRDVTLERQAQHAIEAQNAWLAERVQERTAQLRDSEAHLRSVTSNVPALIAYVDANQRYVYANQQYRERFAPDRPDITGCTVAEVLGSSRYAIASPLIDKVLQGAPQTYDWEPFPGVWQVTGYVPQWDADEHVVGYYVLGTDITERKRAEEKIRTLNAELELQVRDLERTSRALRTLSAGNRTMLRARDEDDLLHSMCKAIVTVGGYGLAIIWYRQGSSSALVPMAECGYPGGLAALRVLKVSCEEGEFGAGVAGFAVRTGRTGTVGDMASDPAHAPWRQHLTGHRSALACPLRVGDDIIGTLAIYDVEPDTFDADEVTLLGESADDLAFGIATLRAQAEQERARATMYQLTHFDALTGLPNQAQFATALEAAVALGHGEGRPFAALQTNIDRLREVNDALGFSHGDAMLREFADRLRLAAPEQALVARLRGDEFAILVPGGDRQSAAALAQRMDERLALPFQVADIPLDVSFKTGIVLFPEHGATPHDVFRHMDIALHQAKQRGGRHAFFDAQNNLDQPSRLSMASQLKRAIDGDQLRLYLQPKVDMRNGRVCGAEALVRWQHPTRGLIPPMQFIELAEHTGLIKSLTLWMLSSVLELNRGWARQGRALPIAVNLSARNLRDEDLLEQIRHMLTRFETAPGLLELEITESTLMEDAPFALGVLHELRALGIPLHIDDFGTGYSSLSYLQRLPVACIKIDQSFVRDMSRNRDSAAIVRSTIDLVHDLGREIVAEGIETLADWEQLARLGCDVAQGYFIARPMPAADFPGWLQGFVPPAAAITAHA
ncbi:MAG: EAL domain-containing protein [Burkholderiales bacterium]|nr:EAL domain-containing protein [Burkholderiales bacterium]